MKLKNVSHYAIYDQKFDNWKSEVLDRWTYDDFVRDPQYKKKWISITSLAYHQPSDAVYLGGWMCQGRMPGSVRARFAAQLEQDPENANAKRMLENFDRALSHPDEADLAAAAFFSNGKLAGSGKKAESFGAYGSACFNNKNSASA